MTESIPSLLEKGTAYLTQNEIDAPRRESEEILTAILGCQRLGLYLDPRNISEKRALRFWNHLERRAAHEPLQYITGFVDFCGTRLSVSKGVFIPRPETELIVEAAEKLSPAPPRILDLCTGSGALAIVLAKHFQFSKVTAVDCSDAALAIAESNVRTSSVSSNITLLKGNLFEALWNKPSYAPPFDLIVCNPPYISESDRAGLPPEVREYEPEIALFASDNGKAFYRRILADAPLFLSDEGVIFLELGYDQSEWLQHHIEEKNRNIGTNISLTFISDWAGIKRIAHISNLGHCFKGSNDG